MITDTKLWCDTASIINMTWFYIWHIVLANLKNICNNNFLLSWEDNGNGNDNYVYRYYHHNYHYHRHNHAANKNDDDILGRHLFYCIYLFEKKIFRSGISRASCIDITIWYRFQYKVWRIAHSQQQGISCSLPKPNKMAPNHIVRVIDYSSATSLPLLIRYDRRTIHHYIFRFGLYQGMRDSGDIFLDLLLKCINVLFGKLR